jgi:hypothetical protein
VLFVPQLDYSCQIAVSACTTKLSPMDEYTTCLSQSKDVLSRRRNPPNDDLQQTQDKQERRREICPESLFIYDSQTDTTPVPQERLLRSASIGPSAKPLSM